MMEFAKRDAAYIFAAVDVVEKSKRQLTQFARIRLGNPLVNRF